MILRIWLQTTELIEEDCKKILASMVWYGMDLVAKKNSRCDCDRFQPKLAIPGKFCEILHKNIKLQDFSI